MMAATALVGLPYGRVPSAPGASAFAARTVEWIRDHGGGPLVDLLETVCFQLLIPSGAAPGPADLPSTQPRAALPAGVSAPAPLAPLPGFAPLPGEGQWQPGRLLGAGTRALVWGLDTDLAGSWGADGSQPQYTWRSGVGVDASGDLVYVGGDRMSLHTLAQALRDAGAIRGMQLDVHSAMVDLFSYPAASMPGSEACRCCRRCPELAPATWCPTSGTSSP